MITPATWLIKNRIIYAHGSGLVTNDDIQQHAQRVIALLDEGIAPVHIVLDSAPDFQIQRADLRSGVANLRFLRHPALGWSVQVLVRNRALGFISTLIARFTRVSYKTMQTREDAFAFLKRVDTSIDWSLLDDSVIHSQQG